VTGSSLVVQRFITAHFSKTSSAFLSAAIARVSRARKGEPELRPPPTKIAE